MNVFASMTVRAEIGARVIALLTFATDAVAFATRPFRATLIESLRGGIAALRTVRAIAHRLGALDKLLKNDCGVPSAPLRDARSLADRCDTSRSLRSVRLASGHPRYVAHQPAKLRLAAHSVGRFLRRFLRAGVASCACILTAGAVASSDGGAPGSNPLRVTAGPTAAAPLPVDQAFPLKASYANGRLSVRIETLPGHYLYRDRFEAAVDARPAALGALPRGQVRQDPFFGRVEVFEQPLDVVIPLPPTARRDGRLLLALTFQGCSERAQVCYPPVTRTFDLAPGRVEQAAVEASKPGLGAMFRKPVSQP